MKTKNRILLVVGLILSLDVVQSHRIEAAANPVSMEGAFNEAMQQAQGQIASALQTINATKLAIKAKEQGEPLIQIAKLRTQWNTKMSEFLVSIQKVVGSLSNVFQKNQELLNNEPKTDQQRQRNINNVDNALTQSRRFFTQLWTQLNGIYEKLGVKP